MSDNYLDLIPQISEGLNWKINNENIVTLEIENKGIFNRIAQMLFKKPKISYIHLDNFGSFVWMQVNGERSITVIGDSVKANFGEKAEPVFERLAKYFQILNSYKFITLK